MFLTILSKLEEENNQPLTGDFQEFDECFVNGSTTEGNFGPKQIVFAMVERDPNGRAVAFPVPNREADTLKEYVLKYSTNKDALISTDEHKSYLLEKWGYTNHHKTLHKAKERINRETSASSQSVENFFSRLKAIHDTHRKISPDHLRYYVALAVWQHNHRNSKSQIQDMFDLLIQ